MPWSIERELDSGIIVSVYRGRVTKEEIAANTARSLAVAADAPPPARFLVDVSQVEAFLLSAADVYEQPDRWRRLRAHRLNRLALIVSDSPAVATIAGLYVDTSRNRGWNVRAFQLRTDAVDWLLGKGPDGDG